jgi:DNA polymerase (family 10)
MLGACGHAGVAVKINCIPTGWIRIGTGTRRALELNCMLSINADAHSIRELGLVKWGVASARKGGVREARIPNALSLEKFRDHSGRRERARRPTAG